MAQVLTSVVHDYLSEEKIGRSQIREDNWRIIGPLIFPRSRISNRPDEFTECRERQLSSVAVMTKVIDFPAFSNILNSLRDESKACLSNIVEYLTLLEYPDLSVIVFITL